MAKTFGSILTTLPPQEQINNKNRTFYFMRIRFKENQAIVQCCYGKYLFYTVREKYCDIAIGFFFFFCNLFRIRLKRIITRHKLLTIAHDTPTTIHSFHARLKNKLNKTKSCRFRFSLSLLGSRYKIYILSLSVSGTGGIFRKLCSEYYFYFFFEKYFHTLFNSYFEYTVFRIFPSVRA